MTAEPAASGGNDTNAQPLVYLFREVDDASGTTVAFLANLGLRCESFTEPRNFLVSLKKVKSSACVIDFTTPKVDIASALIKAIRSVLGPTMPVIAILPKDGTSIIDALSPGGNTSWVEVPLIETELACKFAQYLVTDHIAALSDPQRAPATQETPPAQAPTPQAPPAQAPAAQSPTAIKTPAAPAAELPPFFKWLFEKVIPPLIALRPHVQFFPEAERQLKFYVECFKGMEDQIITMVQRLRRKQEKLDVNQSLRAYGVANSRNLVTTMALANLTVAKSFNFDAKTGMPSHEAKIVVHYAMKTVERFGEGSRFYQTAFSAGLVFDLLARQAQEMGERKRVILKAIEAGHAEAIRRAEKGLKLGKQAEDLAMARHIITTMMMREAGKIAFAMFFENYLEVRKFFEKKTVSHPFQLIAEQENYGLSHNMAAAVLSQAAPNLSDATLSCLFCDIPVPLRGPTEKDLNALATFCRTL